MNRSNTLWAMLVPRPHSFLMNSLLFAAGVIFAWVEGYRGLAGSHSSIPAWLFVFLWYVAQEILVQQAKYMWNDIRDHERDQQIPANRVRPIARQPLSRWMTVIMASRWTVGVILAGLLSPVLLTVVLMISGLQIVYELLAKPRSGTRPLLPLFIVGAGMMLKTGSGALALGVPVGEQRFWLYSLALFATGVVFVSSFWRVEADYFAERSLALPRGHSAYFARHGLAWLKAGTVVTIGACTVLIFDGYSQFLSQVEIRAGLALGLIFAAGIVCCRFCFWLVQGPRPFRIAAGILFISASIAAILLGIGPLFPIPREALTATLLLILLLLDYRLNVNLDYRQQNLLYILENWPKFKRVLRERPSNTTTLLHWRHILQLALALNSSKYEAIRQRQLDSLAPVLPSAVD